MNRPSLTHLAAAVCCLVLFWISLQAPVQHPLGNLESFVESVSRSPWFRFGVMAILSMVLATLLRYLVGMSPGALPLVFTALALGIYFRPQAFFFVDEWHLLQRFREHGWSAAFVSHNEHFIPLSFLLYRAELAVFGDRYALFLLVSVAFHVMNALLLRLFLMELCREMPAGRAVGNLAAVLFLVSGLHGETLHWALLQCVLLGHAFAFLSLWRTLLFLRTGDARELLVVALGMLAAPLCYGGAIVLPLWVMLVGLIRGGVILRRRLLLLLAVCFLTLSSIAGIYLAFRHGAGHGFAESELTGRIAAFFHYVVLGSEYGTILRGSGLLPVAELSSVEPFLRWLAPIRPSFVLCFVGGCVSGWLLLLALRSASEKKFYLRCWIVGHLIIFSQFALIGLGRARLGFWQSLEMRYQYGPLLGLVIIFLPYLLKAAKAFEQETAHSARRGGLVGIFGVYCMSQLFLVQSQNSLVMDGVRTRIYVDQLTDWFSRRKEFLSDDGFEAPGTPLEGLEPYPYFDQSGVLIRTPPLIHPTAIYDALRELNPSRYPARF